MTYCRGSIHDGVLAHESSLGIIEDDKLDWLVNPSVAETELNALFRWGDCTMPQTTRELDDIRRLLSIEADDERRGVNGVDYVSVVGIRSEVLVVLKRRNN